NYITQIIDYVTEHFDVYILFNYAPNQKVDAESIYNNCKHKDAIIFDIYEDNIRGFIQLMNKCNLLVANEGGNVHIAKAMDKPTFTIFSPYVLKEHWASFEDGVKHTSIHLLEEKPDLYTAQSKEERREIENNPTILYNQLTPELIIPKLKAFLDHQLKRNL
ncbi:MAG: glycosyltransferase family 9 protein, partial [Aquaticitalea sp.]